MSVLDAITRKLESAFKPTSLQVIDQSADHAGHAGARPGGETHFRVSIRADAFRAMSRVERQRAVYAALAEELAGPIHALSVDARPPGD